MGIGSGVGAQFGYAVETTWGTSVTPDHFTDFDDESMHLNQTWTEPEGLAAGRQMMLLGRKRQTTRGAEGSVALSYATKKMGPLVRACLGSTVTTPVLVSGSNYKQVHQLGDFTGVSLTTQIGRPQTDGTSKPFTYPGTKVTGWELSSSEGESVKLSLDLDAKDEITATGLATASYPTGVEEFGHDQLVVKLGGTASTASSIVSIASGVTLASVLKGVSVKGSNPMANERFGTGTTKNQPIQNGLVEISIDLDVEFNAQSEIYDVWRAGTAIPVQLTWTGSTAGNSLDLVFAAAKFTEAPPNVDGPDLVKATATLVVGADGTNNPAQWTVFSQESSV